MCIVGGGGIKVRTAVTLTLKPVFSVGAICFCLAGPLAREAGTGPADAVT